MRYRFWAESFSQPGRKLEQKASCRGQSRMAPRRAVSPCRARSASRLKRHQPVATGRAGDIDLQSAEQYIKEGKNAINWTRLSCLKFRNNAVRPQVHALAYNVANFMRTLALPKEVEHWSLTTLRA